MARHLKLFPWMLLFTAAAFGGLTWSSIRLYQAHDYHRHLADGALNTNTFLGSDQTPQALFANAWTYRDRGQSDKALATYAQVIARSDLALRKAAYYNTGNLYLNQATTLLEKEGLSAWGNAGPLVALAKESYQKALRLQPDWSEAKYNYQLALRLAPTTYGMKGPQQYEDETLKQDERPSGWPEMPGNPRGMP